MGHFKRVNTTRRYLYNNSLLRVVRPSSWPSTGNFTRRIIRVKFTWYPTLWSYGHSLIIIIRRCLWYCLGYFFRFRWSIAFLDNNSFWSSVPQVVRCCTSYCGVTRGGPVFRDVVTLLYIIINYVYNMMPETRAFPLDIVLLHHSW